MSNTAHFRIIYDGDALVNHEMNVKDLAPALFSIGELLEEANLVLNGEKTKVLVNVKGSPDSGSISIDFSVVQDFLNKTMFFFSDKDNIEVANTILAFLGIGGVSSIGYGLIKFIRWLKNRKIKNIIKISFGNLKIELDDGDSTVVQNVVIKLFQNTKIRRSLETVIKKPLDQNGIESIAFKYKENEEKIEKKEAEYYAMPEVDAELIDESDTHTSLQMVSVSFQEGNKWRFTEGSGGVSFYADILDLEFIERVQKNEEAFSKDDILKVILHKRQYLTEEGMKIDYLIKKVLSHRSAAVQIQLPFSDKEDSKI